MSSFKPRTVPARAPDRTRYIEIDDEDNVQSTLNLEPDPSTIRPSRAATRIIKRLPLAPVSTAARRDSQRSRRSSTDEGPVAGPSRLPILAAPASGMGMSRSKHVFDRLVEGEGVTEEDWEMTEVCGSCGLRFLRKALSEHI